MSHIINRSGAETDLFDKLAQNGIHRFSSIDELFSFKTNYRFEFDNLREKKAAEILNEMESLARRFTSLRTEYELQRDEQSKLIYKEIWLIKADLTRLPQNFASDIKRYSLQKKLSYLETYFDRIVDAPLLTLKDKIEETKNRLLYLYHNEQEEIARRSASLKAESERIMAVLTQLGPYIYGAIGEQRAIQILRTLPDNYYIINDYRHTFNRPLHKKDDEVPICSIQLDHVVVGPTGVFVIETKYWSQNSIMNPNLFSPVRQLKRGGYALFVMLNERIRQFVLFNNNWGTIQVPVERLLLMMNATTNEQFQFVKILTASNLLHHITHRSTTLSREQVDCLVKEVLQDAKSNILSF